VYLYEHVTDRRNYENEHLDNLIFGFANCLDRWLYRIPRGRWVNSSTAGVRNYFSGPAFRRR
jgi:hypothetical protein